MMSSQVQLKLAVGAGSPRLRFGIVTPLCVEGKLVLYFEPCLPAPFLFGGRNSGPYQLDGEEVVAVVVVG